MNADLPPDPAWDVALWRGPGWIREAGLVTLPAQTWNSVRLVPLARDEPIEGLRLDRRAYDEPSIVDVGDRTHYISYIPHAFVAHWEEDAATASYGTRLLARDDKGTGPSGMPIRVRRRMARRLAGDRLRFLPLHLAVEGYLALHFGGPEIAWEEWSRRALASGLSPREERAYLGASVPDLADALRIFEMHPGQCGVLVYVADALAAAFVVPHPDDYRALHPTLVEDLFGELIYQYGLLRLPVEDLVAPIDASAVRTLADLRAQAERRMRDWADFHDGVMAEEVFAPGSRFEDVRRISGARLSRFLPPFTPGRPNHIGETIVVGEDEDARLAYLKTFRLSEKQVRRGYLLTRLAANGWRLADTAAEFGVGEPAFALRLERAGFGHLLRQDVLDRYRAAARR
ncbi:ARPP-2 domain-containing protein [Actinomadura gamaensis]|uniref:ARG and Rhodanese-Phosphatase-superfamily-associated domain-containing protein n=1 Tax=Actinomadura gamaensis TaxID=1763541 RepID=A0ABV9UDP1_9ACTN